MGNSPSGIAKIISNLPWIELVADAWKFGRKTIRGLTPEGMYEVIEFESTLELLDGSGKKARYKKRKKVRYLQNNIIAYQDHSWGDGKLLRNYKCTPGVPVDQYRSGYKTYVLISLREVKSRGDIDEFNIHWDYLNGFLKPDGFWDTDIVHRTKRVQVNVIFPKDRPPKRVTIVESNRRKTHVLDIKNLKPLPDGRVRVTWEKKNPRIFEHYLMKWVW